MIRKILTHLYIDKLSFGETAIKLDISSESLKEILDNMEHMGYIRKVHEDTNTTCPTCRNCGNTGMCHTETSNISAKKLILTEKGKRICDRKKKQDATTPK
ncbi:MAG: Lrp/AsnC family transcriptional regulator [Methanosarcinaceae archaeon]|nr:Lrp/AsnC family transcriptional regulator [Methanosarcinaceae archaeon]